MRAVLFPLALVLGFGLAALSPPPAQAASGAHVVSGVSEDDMLKLRAGPGTGYKVLLGLPNGTEVRVIRCESSGGHRWCEISLNMARGLRGWVSLAYLRQP